MKTILVLSILFSLIALPALCQTPQSAVETEIAVIKTEITNLKENVNNGFNNVQKNFDNVQKNARQNFDNIQKNFDRQNNIIIACIGIPLAILAINVKSLKKKINRINRNERHKTPQQRRNRTCIRRFHRDV